MTKPLRVLIVSEFPYEGMVIGGVQSAVQILTEALSKLSEIEKILVLSFSPGIDADHVEHWNEKLTIHHVAGQRRFLLPTRSFFDLVKGKAIARAFRPGQKSPVVRAFRLCLADTTEERVLLSTQLKKIALFACVVDQARPEAFSDALQRRPLPLEDVPPELQELSRTPCRGTSAGALLLTSARSVVGYTQHVPASEGCVVQSVIDVSAGEKLADDAF